MYFIFFLVIKIHCCIFIMQRTLRMGLFVSLMYLYYAMYVNNGFVSSLFLLSGRLARKVDDKVM